MMPDRLGPVVRRQRSHPRIDLGHGDLVDEVLSPPLEDVRFGRPTELCGSASLPTFSVTNVIHEDLHKVASRGISVGTLLPARARLYLVDQLGRYAMAAFCGICGST